jgi:hypothetical protein
MKPDLESERVGGEARKAERPSFNAAAMKINRRSPSSLFGRPSLRFRLGARRVSDVVFGIASANPIPATNP